MVRKLLLVNETSINANKFAQRANDETNKTNKMYYTQEDRDNYSNNVLKQPEFYVLNYFVCYTKDL